MLHLFAHSSGDQSSMTTGVPIPERTLPAMSRRRFLTAGALLVGFVCARPALAAGEPDLMALGAMDAAATGFDGFVPDGFIRIGSDGRIILVVPSVEMGQGIATGEAMMLAEELEVDLDQVEVVMAPPDIAALPSPFSRRRPPAGQPQFAPSSIPCGKPERSPERCWFGRRRSAGRRQKTNVKQRAVRFTIREAVERPVMPHLPRRRAISWRRRQSL
jgi:hypothetical protein